MLLISFTNKVWIYGARRESFRLDKNTLRLVERDHFINFIINKIVLPDLYQGKPSVAALKVDLGRKTATIVVTVSLGTTKRESRHRQGS